MSMILTGILRAPYPDDPSEMGVVEWSHLRDAAASAADEIESLRKRVEELEFWVDDE